MSYDSNEEEFNFYDFFAEDKSKDEFVDVSKNETQFDPSEELLAEIA